MAAGAGLIGLVVGVLIVAAVPLAVSWFTDAPACPKLALHAGVVTFVYLAVVTGQELFRNIMWAAVAVVAVAGMVILVRRVLL